MNIPIVEENDDLINLYWTPNLHNNLGRKRYFTNITVLFGFDGRKCSFTWRRITTLWIILILVLFFVFRKVIYPNILPLYTVCRNHNPVISSFMTYHLICNKSNTTGATSGTGTAYHSH